MSRNYEILVEGLNKNKVVKGWTRGVPIDPNTIEQLRTMASMPFVHPYIAAMPDAHWGMGSCVGSVIPTLDAIMPAAVGVDIGCGMMAYPTELRRSDFAGIEDAVRKSIMMTVPAGRTQNGGPRDEGGWDGFLYREETPEEVKLNWTEILEPLYLNIVADDPAIGSAKTVEHLGTLGTGNHFIELATDETDTVWILLHSGSRGVGNRIGTYFTKMAKERCKDWYVDLPDQNLAFFPKGEPEFYRYWRALHWAQDYAWRNRELMMDLTRQAIMAVTGHFIFGPWQQCVHIHHNYAEYEQHFGKNLIVTRKGAVRAKRDELAIIPGSMGDASFITRGLGNYESFNSCSHGAGRVMSRTEARKQISLEAHDAATMGVYCEKGEGVLDESPSAYKDIGAVMAAQADLVKIEHTLKAFINVKGLSDRGRR